MSNFLPPTTVAKTVAAIQQRRYVLPAIQREFVWDSDQVCGLFDSLLRGYPIGSLLFWAVDGKQAQDFRFYEFQTDYHERNHPHADVAHIPVGSGVTAVLDGQQRLTALNLGLYGSLAERLPRKWASNPDAYPVKRLHLDLLHDGDGEDGLASKFRFRFLTDAEAAPAEGEPWQWFKVSRVLGFKERGPDMLDWLDNHGFTERPREAYRRLDTLHRAVVERETLNAYQEDDQDPNTVLDIFVRVNSGGTPLSYSDLLLSMATNQWLELDARLEVRNLVDDLDSTGLGLTRDNVLKTALVLIDLTDIRFNVANFTSANMAELEKQWAGVRQSMLLAARLLRSFGLTAQTLSAKNVVIPIAYYLYRREATDNYVRVPSTKPEREAIRTWVMRSLVKRGIWGSGSDTLLSRLRDVIKQTPVASGWPAEAIESAMDRMGKTLTLSPAEISELAELQYNSARTFAVLTFLYPGLDLAHEFHEDHVFPRSKFSAAQLRKHGIAEDRRAAYTDAVNGLANLQLLEGPANIAKKDAWPWEWLQSSEFTSEAARENYRARNDLDLLPETFDGFLDFYAARRARLEGRLRTVLDVEESATP